MSKRATLKHGTSFDIVLNKWRQIRSDSSDGLKVAMLQFIGVIAFGITCFILRPFFCPLLWAFLVGAVLFPFKRKLASSLNKWFKHLEESNSNVFLAVCISPLEVLDNLGKKLFTWLKSHWGVCLATFFFCCYMKLFFLYSAQGFFSAVWKSVTILNSIFAYIMNLLNIYMLSTILIGYSSFVFYYWHPDNSTLFAITGQLLWLFLAGYGCSFFGVLQVPAFIISLCCITISMLLFINKISGVLSYSEGFKKLLDKEGYKSVFKVTEKTNFEKTAEQENIGSKTSTTNRSSYSNSNLYFKLLFFICIVTFLYRNCWMFFLILFPFAVHLTTLLGELGLWNLTSTKIEYFYSNIQVWTLERHSALLPLWLPGIIDLNHKMQIYIRNYLKSSVDMVTSVLMIVLMILFVIFLGVFICVNIYSETIEIAYLCKDLINKTMTNRPELINVLPDNIQSTIDDAIDNAHFYGRRKIENYVEDLFKNVDHDHSEILKVQILNVWDRLIQYWIDLSKESGFGPHVSSEALKTTFGEIVENPSDYKELVLVAKQGIIGWAKSNTNTILEVAESLWHIIRTNVSLIMTITGGFFSLLISGGQAFIDFFLNVVIFFTALFYLLQSSQDKYAPLQIANYMEKSSISKIADALENSITDVLVSILKSALFQGLFTWLVHIIFGAKIVFLPSVLAAFLSAAPFLGSYWCAVPAFLDVWLAQNRFYSGILLLSLMFIIPPYVDQEIHAEMKGSIHPYLIGLAIAGGMYWLGLQGAVFGPLLLCFFIGIFEVASINWKIDEPKRLNISEESQEM